MLSLSGWRFNRLSAHLRSSAMFWAFVRPLMRLASSPNVTSSCQCRLFSIPHWPRSAAPYSRADARRLPMNSRNSALAFSPTTRSL